MFGTKRINNEVVKPVPLIEAADTRPIKGHNLFPELYANIFLCSKKKSGKTSSIYKIVQKCCGPNTCVLAFCSTLNKDPSWATIRAWCERKGIVFIGQTSLKSDNGADLLDELITGLAAPEQEKPRNMLDSDDEDEAPERKPKYRSPEYLIILDDLSNELKTASLTTLLKKNRHFKAKIILSSQYLNDMLPGSRRQLDYFILFRGHPKNKIEEIYRDADISVPLEQFYQVYKFATLEPYSFLYIDCANGTFRRNVNESILLSS